VNYWETRNWFPAWSPPVKNWSMGKACAVSLK